MVTKEERTNGMGLGTKRLASGWKLGYGIRQLRVSISTLEITSVMSLDVNILSLNFLICKMQVKVMSLHSYFEK
jgi:hypothetical protein